MSILQVISSEGFYGAESMLCNLGAALIRAGQQATVAVFEDRRAPHIEVADVARSMGVPVRLINCDGRLDRSAVHELRSAIRQTRATVVHSHGYKADLYCLAAARREPVALISTCHNWPDKRILMRGYAMLDRLALRFFDRVATPSREVARTLRKSGVKLGSINYIGNGIDISRFTSAAPTVRAEITAGTSTIVGFVGRLISGKGGDLLLHAVSRIVNVFPDVLFVFAGEGELRSRWIELSAELQITRHVRFLGPRTDMPNVYASLDMLVLPSLNEAMPMVVLEAMASGKPVIATRVGAIPEVVLDGVSGTVIRPGSVDDIVTAVLQLLRSPDLARQYGRNGFDFVSQTYSSEVMARNYLSLYDSARVDLALQECA